MNSIIVEREDWDGQASYYVSVLFSNGLRREVKIEYEDFSNDLQLLLSKVIQVSELAASLSIIGSSTIYLQSTSNSRIVNTQHVYPQYISSIPSIVSESLR
jgi:hypothetical protein